MDGSAVHLKAAVMQSRIFCEVDSQIFYTRMDGMRKMKNLQRWHKSIEIFGPSTMFFFVTSHQLLFCIFDHRHEGV